MDISVTIIQMDNAVNNIDEYTIRKDRRVLIGDQTWLGSLTTFGHAVNNKAELPLVNHYHKDKMEFVIVVDGIQKYTASDIEYTLYGGDVFITQPNEAHSSGKSPQAVNELLWFQIDLSPAKDFLGLNEQGGIQLLNRIVNFEGRKFQLDKELITGFLRAFNHICKNDINEKVKGQCLFVYCLMCLLDQKPTLTVLSKDIDSAKQYILTHITETIDMDILIGTSGLSSSRFKQKFKEQVGFTPREYINYMKIDKAKEQIASSKDSITDIAFDFSFSTSNYFCVVFKQFTGYSPKEYRKRFGNK